MAWFLGVATLLVVVIGVAVGIGASLPREHVATIRARFKASPDALWAIINDPYSATSWRKDLKKVDRLPDVGTHPSWSEHGRFGIVTYVLTESTSGRSRTTRIADEGLPYGGQWEWALQPLASGSELTITERGFVKPALFRFVSRVVFGYTATMRDQLVSIGATLGEETAPEVLASGR